MCHYATVWSCTTVCLSYHRSNLVEALQQIFIAKKVFITRMIQLSYLDHKILELDMGTGTGTGISKIPVQNTRTNFPQTAQISRLAVCPNSR